MGKGGKYLKKNVPVAAGKKKKKSKVKKVLLVILVVVLLILAIAVGFGVWYYNYLINLVSRPDDYVPVNTTPSISAEATQPTEAQTLPEETTVGTTSPEDTWPEIISDENITNIMLVGQAAREGEEGRIADTMILCSINRETKTLTMTSLMRDLRLTWPRYVDVNGQPHTGFNRINMAYNMGYRWDGNPQGGMNVLASIVEYNFGVPVHNTVEVNFDVFQQVMELLGGVDLELSEAEVKYLQDNYPASITGKSLKPGMNHLSPYLTLGYARMRKVGDGDFERSERQRKVITLLLEKLKGMNILEVNELFKTVLPMITTDMTNKEITNYSFEFIPMLKDLKIQSQRIPFDGTYWPVVVNIPGQATPDNQIDCNVEKNGEMLRESIGMTEPVE